MEMTGEQLIPVGQNEVWRGLNDPEVLRACIPGAETIEKVSDNEYKVAMVAAVGPVKARFAGKMALSDINPPNSYSIAFEGSGGAAGFAKGSAQVSLAPEGAGTRLSYSAKANVGGKLAQIGSRLIDGVARKTADDFFVRFNQIVAAQSPAAATSAATPAAVPPAPAAALAQAGASVPEEAGSAPLWVVATIVVAMTVVAMWIN